MCSTCDFCWLIFLGCWLHWPPSQPIEVIVPSCLDPCWYTIDRSTSQLMIAICQYVAVVLIIHHWWLVKLFPQKKCSVWYVLPHISERNPETSSNMAITCSYIKCQHLSTPYQPFATSATNANTSSFYPKHGCSKHPRCNPREAIIYLQWAGATLPIERSYGKSPWFLAPCHLPNGHLSIAFHSYVELCWMPETKHVFCESSSKSPRPSIKSC